MESKPDLNQGECHVVRALVDHCGAANVLNVLTNIIAFDAESASEGDDLRNELQKTIRVLRGEKPIKWKREKDRYVSEDGHFTILRPRKNETWTLLHDHKILAGFYSLDFARRNAERYAAVGRLIGHGGGTK